jgi:hypothetical protein
VGRLVDGRVIRQPARSDIAASSNVQPDAVLLRLPELVNPPSRTHADFGLSYRIDVGPVTGATFLVWEADMTTDTWKGGEGNWTVASEWSEGIPTSTSDVVIPVGSAAVYIGSDVGSIKSLSIAQASGDNSAALRITSRGSLDVLGPAGDGSTGVLTGYLQPMGGSIVFESGQINTIAANSDLYLDGAGVVADVGHLHTNSALDGLETVAGQFDVLGSVPVIVSGSLDVAKGGLIDVGGYGGTSQLDVHGVLTNNGLITDIFGEGSSNSLITTTKGLTNRGTIMLEYDDYRLGGSVTNDGKIELISDSQDFYWWVGGAGSFDIAGYSNAGFYGGVDADQAIYFGGAAATLTLRDASAFFGKIGGFGAGDAIDAKDFRKGTTWSFAENSNNASGVLTLMNGADEARLLFFGSYAKDDFSFTSSSAGTSIKFV